MEHLANFKSRRVVLQVETLVADPWTVHLITNAIGVPQIVAFGPLAARHYRWLDEQYGITNWDLEDRRHPSAAAQALRSYFDGDLNACDNFPADAGGSALQQAVWKLARGIPAGSVASYRWASSRLGTANFRKVAYASASNPVPILIPTHRLLDTAGEIGGYGRDFALYSWLLQHEGVECRGRLATTSNWIDGRRGAGHS